MNRPLQKVNQPEKKPLIAKWAQIIAIDIGTLHYNRSRCAADNHRNGLI